MTANLPDYRTPSNTVNRKVRINPLYILLTLVALLPFYVLYLRHSQQQAGQVRRMRLDRISVELPGDQQVSAAMLKSGVHYLGSAGAKVETLVALVPMYPKSSLAVAFASGTLETAQEFTRLFPQLHLDRLVCRSAAPGQYRLEGVRRDDGWHLAAHLAALPDGPEAVVILSITPKATESKRLTDAILLSLRIEMPGEYGAANRAQPEEPAVSPAPESAPSVVPPSEPVAPN